MAITVAPGKTWDQSAEVLDSADLDAAAAPLFSIAPNSLGSTEIFSAKVLLKIGSLGGVGMRQSYSGDYADYTFPAAVAVGAGSYYVTPYIPLRTIAAGDFVELAYVPQALYAFDFVAFATSVAGYVKVSVFNFTAATAAVPAGATIYLIGYHYP